MDDLDLSGADTTIFTSGSDMTSEERSAVKSGEKRGERVAMAEDPERFGLARQRGLGRKKYEEAFERINGRTTKLNVWPRDKNGNLIDD